MSLQIDWVGSCYCVFSLCVYKTDKIEDAVCHHLLSVSQLLCAYKYIHSQRERFYRKTALV